MWPNIRKIIHLLHWRAITSIEPKPLSAQLADWSKTNGQHEEYFTKSQSNHWEWPISWLARHFLRRLLTSWVVLFLLHFPDDWNEERSDEWNEEQFRNETRAETGLEWPVSARTKVFSLKGLKAPREAVRHSTRRYAPRSNPHSSKNV